MFVDSLFMRRAAFVLICAFASSHAAAICAQERAAGPPQLAEQPEFLLPLGPTPEAVFDQPPSLPPAAPRVGLIPPLAPVADPRVIFFHPYFFPTHFNFRPLPYGYPPTELGFFYGAFANPYYYQYYGPGAYYGF
jgi:hypothetical protein